MRRPYIMCDVCIAFSEVWINFQDHQANFQGGRNEASSSVQIEPSNYVFQSVLELWDFTFRLLSYVLPIKLLSNQMHSQYKYFSAKKPVHLKPQINYSGDEKRGKQTAKHSLKSAFSQAYIVLCDLSFKGFVKSMLNQVI